jgi:hypothetical protein
MVTAMAGAPCAISASAWAAASDSKMTIDVPLFGERAI